METPGPLILAVYTARQMARVVAQGLERDTDQHLGNLVPSVPRRTAEVASGGFRRARRLKAIEVVGEHHRARVHPRDHRLRFRLSSQRA
jgi:hypothetical protein